MRRVERLADLADAEAAAEAGEAARREPAETRARQVLDRDREPRAVAREVARLERRDAEREVTDPAHGDPPILHGPVEVREKRRDLREIGDGMLAADDRGDR